MSHVETTPDIFVPGRDLRAGALGLLRSGRDMPALPRGRARAAPHRRNAYAALAEGLSASGFAQTVRCARSISSASRRATRMRAPSEREARQGDPMQAYDYIVVGSGFFGAVFAQQMREAGKSVLVWRSATTSAETATRTITRIPGSPYTSTALTSFIPRMRGSGATSTASPCSIAISTACSRPIAAKSSRCRSTSGRSTRSTR